MYLIKFECLCRFQSRTSEAAKLEAEVGKAQETIRAAEILISQLDREHRRWNAQVCLTERGQKEDSFKTQEISNVMNLLKKIKRREISMNFQMA